MRPGCNNCIRYIGLMLTLSKVAKVFKEVQKTTETAEINKKLCIRLPAEFQEQCLKTLLKFPVPRLEAVLLIGPDALCMDTSFVCDATVPINRKKWNPVYLSHLFYHLLVYFICILLVYLHTHVCAYVCVYISACDFVHSFFTLLFYFN